MTTLHYILIFRLLIQDYPPHPSDMEDGETAIYNSRPGVVASESTNGTGSIGTNTVSSSRGAGDASFSYSLWTVWGNAWTGLDYSAPESPQGYLCAQVMKLQIETDNKGGSSNSCGYRSPGGTVTASTGDHFAACGSFIFVESSHSISQGGFYWQANDYDGTSSFCYE